MSRRSNVLGGVGVDVSPTSNSTINNNIVIRNVPTEQTESSPKLVSYDNPYTEERDVASAEKRLEAIEELVLLPNGKTAEQSSPKENDLCKALSLMLDVVYENPLIINKYVVTDAATLRELIRLLTNSNEVKIFIEDPECQCIKNNFAKVSSIHVISNGVTNEFKYSHQNAKYLLDKHHISTKYILN